MRLQAEKLAIIAPDLKIRANKLANTVWEGIHNRNKAGIGDNFWQFKKYEYGDPVHLIDWKKSAKSSSFFIQEQELSTVQNINIWRDSSNSMNYSSRKSLDKKIYIANLITLVLSMILIKQSEKVKINGSNINYSNSEEAINLISDQLSNIKTNNNNFKPNIEEIDNGSNCILIGDFLYSTENIEKIIKNLSSRKINGMLIHIIDPAEQKFPFKGRVNFKGLEGENPHLIGNAESVQKEYLKKFKKHLDTIKIITESYKWNYFMHITDQELVELVIKIYTSFINSNTKDIEI